MAASADLARVLASPDDLQLRQVLADTLQDTGDPRGTFISMQLELLPSPGRDRALPPSRQAFVGVQYRERRSSTVGTTSRRT